MGEGDDGDEDEEAADEQVVFHTQNLFLTVDPGTLMTRIPLTKSGDQQPNS
jgi:hypothetical protein